MMLTAGHCGRAELEWFSGSQSYGYTKHSRYFRYNGTLASYGDLMLIGKSGDSYQPVMYSDPGSPATRQYTATKDLTPGVAACLSGSYTRAVCGAVTDRNQWAQDENGVRTFVAVVYKTGAQIAGPGDSGGPAYGRNGTNTADFRGLITGVTCADSQGNTLPCGTAYIQNPSEVLTVYAGLNPQFAF
jgi:hypothetical protein